MFYDEKPSRQREMNKGKLQTYIQMFFSLIVEEDSIVRNDVLETL